MEWSVRRFEVIEQWMTTATREQCDAMVRWLKVLRHGPQNFVSGAIEHHERRGRPLYFAVVPDADAMVTMFVGDAPVRVITFVSVVPAPMSDWHA